MLYCILHVKCSKANSQIMPSVVLLNFEPFIHVSQIKIIPAMRQAIQDLSDRRLSPADKAQLLA